mmetsp:Transcript_30257/g.54893  ORF Transcript_30257/g.54893 Transcript_30257/m.54893 type:complete len:316 (-) Transcript_30257:79-1026(-)|eukprot:CAMPEP_0197653484 /NCGR_PEP_ID=MMETSP1338-20131121/35732_1 /TAXON_ID=43686 ORGANISM="Pelagodinium beii, Strain RCC1491" /NCGR_SAMPLE_ID=MMETSP1338 /ASSEMBLY_ACC=CAM_ASM_000754 /LENGTH=315 /DNA_ID=CAMNT_0043228611 /DNA_START=94 /DNA_END=1041 /DNA_ORIENTATION=-
MAKKAPKKSFFDMVVMWLSILSGVLYIGALIPKIPWMQADIWGGFHSRFGVKRNFHPYGATDKNSINVSWFSLKSKICSKKTELNTDSPVSFLKSAGSQALASVGGVKTGGALVGCESWPSCKVQVANRCSQYQTVSICGILGLMLVASACCLAFVVPVMVGNESAKAIRKKKKKVKEAKQVTMAVCISTFACGTIGSGLWIAMVDSMFKALSVGSDSAYPTGYATFGYFLVMASNVMMFFCMIISIIRFVRFSTEKKEDETDDEALGPPPPPPGFAGSPFPGSDPAFAAPPGVAPPPEVPPAPAAPGGDGPPGL